MSSPLLARYVEKLQKIISSNLEMDNSAVETVISFVQLVNQNLLVELENDRLSNVTPQTEKKPKTTIQQVIIAVEKLFPDGLQKLSISAGTCAVERYKLFLKNSKFKRYSKSKRAGLVFPITTTKHFSAPCSVFYVAILEFLATVMIENAIEAASCDERTTITDHDVYRGIFGDETDPNHVVSWMSGDEYLKTLACRVNFIR
jgi:hypothetical protein